LSGVVFLKYIVDPLLSSVMLLLIKRLILAYSIVWKSRYFIKNMD